MEIWQHLLVLILTASGLFIGRLIGKRTASEVKYAKKYLAIFSHLTLFFLVVLLIYEYNYWVYGMFSLLLFYGVYFRMMPRENSFIPSTTRTNIFFVVFGLLYGFLSKSPLALAFSAIVFIDGIVMGSLYSVDKKEMKDILIPGASYVLMGILSVLVIGSVMILR